MSPSSRTLDLFPIGNCAVSALVDTTGSIVWSCQPRPDGEPVFSALLDPVAEDAGFWSVNAAGPARVSQDHLRNTAVLRTVFEAEDGSSFEVIDFAPRFRQWGRVHRPAALVRMIRPLSGSPRVVTRLRPTAGYGERRVEPSRGSNHAAYDFGAFRMRLTTNAPLSYVLAERPFRLEGPLAFYFGPDEPYAADVAGDAERLLAETVADWQDWVRGLALPLDWQEAVIRAAVGLRLCSYEETGAIVAALTTSIPESPGTQRTWDYRYCWIRDAYYVVRALNRIGATDMLENYLGYLRNLVDMAEGGDVQPVYGVGLEPALIERFAEGLRGYRGNGPVRVGNQAHEQRQHDVYGQIVMPLAQSFFDRRLLRLGAEADFEALERVGLRAFALHDQPDAGLWEFRTFARVHTYSALLCWAACDRLANVAAALGRAEKAEAWRDRARIVRERIEAEAWNPELGAFAAGFGDATMDASLLQLADLGFVAPDDPRFEGTLARVEHELRRGENLFRYAHEDDFGEPETAFNFCTFWYVETLHRAGRSDEARALFEALLSRRTRSGLLSEDVSLETGELWGNYPQTYSLVGLITCATALSRPWSAVR